MRVPFSLSKPAFFHHGRDRRPPCIARTDSDDDSATTLVESSSNLKKSASFDSLSDCESTTDASRSEEHPRVDFGESFNQVVVNDGEPRVHFDESRNQVLVCSTNDRRHHVHFDESLNQEHDNSMLYKEDCGALWYSPQDFVRFRKERREDVLLLRSLERMVGQDPHSWAKTLQDAYSVCVTAKHPRDLRILKEATAVILQTNKFMMGSPMTIGLEQRAIPSIHLDIKARNEQLKYEVWHCDSWSSADDSDDDDHWDRLRNISRQYSLPCRLYARHVAVLAAAVHEL